MTRLAIQTRRNTVTETRSFAQRPGTQFFERGEPWRGVAGFSAGVGLEPLPVGPYLLTTPPGVEALIDYRRHQYLLEGETAEILAVVVEEDTVRLLTDWSRGLAALISARDAARLSSYSHLPSSGHGTSWLPEVTFLDQKETKGSEEELEMVDWDVRIETPPPRRAERVVVTFREGSYRPPRIVDDPED